ncbi:MAG TPA: hypothetical protein DDY32_11885 [Desulfobulbaceae bacterium]|nr:hypothetical protein [Desulfobulbaceae bacterium]
MIKSILILAVGINIAMTGTVAFAFYWDGYWSGSMGGLMAMVNGGSYQGFYEKTAKIRQDLAAKQAEYSALMAMANPDSQRAADLNREITVLHDQLSSQANRSLDYREKSIGGGAKVYQLSEIIVLLLFLPVFMNIILPLGMLAGWFVWRLLKLLLTKK